MPLIYRGRHILCFLFNEVSISSAQRTDLYEDFVRGFFVMWDGRRVNEFAILSFSGIFRKRISCSQRWDASAPHAVWPRQTVPLVWAVDVMPIQQVIVVNITYSSSDVVAVLRMWPSLDRTASLPRGARDMRRLSHISCMVVLGPATGCGWGPPGAAGGATGMREGLLEK